MKTDPVIFPATVVIDTREQANFTFADLRTDAKEGNRPLIVPTVRGTLRTADYSLSTFESNIVIERKEISDLFNCCGGDRTRFERELQRLNSGGYDYAAVVVEADWAAITTSPPPRSAVKPKIVYRSIIAWQIRYPMIHWWLCPGRRFAEVATFRLLERFWKVTNGNAARTPLRTGR